MQTNLLKRTRTSGELRKSDVGNTVILCGWISKRRDHGGLIFIDLRDRYGKTQVVFNEKLQPEAYKQVFRLGLEDVIGVKGKVIPRPEDAVNKEMPTGEIDVEAEQVEVYNEADPMPFDVNDRSSAMEDHRLKYRYLDLRTKEMQENLRVRNKAAQITRQFLNKLNFLEIETPVLMKSTPEGARDFLVPSRLHAGKFYALPQSPQTYKQLLMVSGIDSYFQIVKCFRDEDFRADRQPEFTQIDLEMSFVDQDDVIDLGTLLLRTLWQEILKIELPNPFPVLTYREAMERFGIDRPDMRFGMELQEFSPYVEKSNFNVFKSVLDAGGRVKAIAAPGCSKYSRRIIDELTDFIKNYHGAKGLAWMKVQNNYLEGGISKFFPDEVQAEIISELSLTEGDCLFIIGDDPSVVFSALAALRVEIARKEKLIDLNKWAPLWVIDFPLVEWNDDENRWDAIHHPFTTPRVEDIPKIETDPADVRSVAYDIVMNGYELGGGSIRIHSSQLQAKVFALLGITEQEAAEKFGFLMDAFRFGAPPHGGMAFGFDRIIMLLTGSKHIRDVIAFPKTTSAVSLMDDSPSVVSEKQLDELHLNIKKKEITPR